MMIDGSIKRIFEFKSKISEPGEFDPERLITLKDRIQKLNQNLN